MSDQPPPIKGMDAILNGIMMPRALAQLMFSQNAGMQQPSTALPGDQMQHLGSLFAELIHNYPEDINYFIEQATAPQGKLGRTLTEQERNALDVLINTKIR